MNEKTFDIAIVGAGLTGLLTAFSLSRKNLNIAIIDKGNIFDSKSLKNDFRTTAIAEGSKVFIQELDFWKELDDFAQPIQKILVYDRNDSNKINFQHPLKNSFLGYIIKNSIIKKKLIEKLSKQKNINFFCNNSLNQIDFFKQNVEVRLTNDQIIANLVIAADGKNSWLRNRLKTPIYKKKYNHDAMVLNISHNLSHKNIAYELFFESGPLAILPMLPEKGYKYSSSIVWSNNKQYLFNLEKLQENFLINILEEKLKKYIGNIKKIHNKKTFNLSAHINSSLYENRLVYVGDAAHSLHPIAGQGWNLGIRDIKNLSNSLEEGAALGLDVGDKFITKQYHNLSFGDAFSLYQITDKLNSIFLNEKLIIKTIRHLGFDFIEKNSNINNLITSYAMGNNLHKKVN